jgi:hypothetical protein
MTRYYYDYYYYYAYCCCATTATTHHPVARHVINRHARRRLPSHASPHTHTHIDIRLIYADIQQYADAPRPMLALSHARIYTPHLIERGGVVWQGEVVAKFLAP